MNEGRSSDRLEVGHYIQIVVGALPGNHRNGPVDSTATGFELGSVGRLAKDIMAIQRHADGVACPPRGLQIDKNLAAKSLNFVRIGEACRARGIFEPSSSTDKQTVGDVGLQVEVDRLAASIERGSEIRRVAGETRWNPPAARY